MAEFSFENVFIGSLKYFWSNIVFYLKCFGLSFLASLVLIFIFGLVMFMFAFSLIGLLNTEPISETAAMPLVIGIVFFGTVLYLAFLIFSFFINFIVMRLAYKNEEVRDLSFLNKLKQESQGFWRFLGWMFLFILFSFVILVLPFIGFSVLLIFSVSSSHLPFTLLTISGLLGFTVFAIFAFFKWFFFVPSLLVEKILRTESFGILSAMKENCILVKGRWWLTFGIYALFILLAVLVSFVVSVSSLILVLPLYIIPLAGPIFAQLINQAINYFVGFFVGLIYLILPFFMLHEYRRMDKPVQKAK
ncbi:MAG TPA: hypothetical protein ENN46_01485 [Candidatus Woesearchaeota archaeon]|nr:hypothetical protein [Candidatus Woesearchaeota archaeon]